MSSRRVMQRSYSGDGRTGLHNADDVSGRPSSRSYLSNVRPESRSTLCSVMAQLAEETQPTFELTLRSRAVSEKCKVTFTCEVKGHPIPEVIWYKDDVQLDRYCGLPKYEIFRNGPNHCLHIYNCTVEDAAIYQASASNTKGIVSCSGVLEVGLMNEYLIHQRYFSKLKQKAENRRRDLEGRENQGVAEQEPLRSLSPDRSQRKRRSPMAPHFSAPGSMEVVPKPTRERPEAPGPGAEAAGEARLQDSTAGATVAKPPLLANGESVAPAVNGHEGVMENGGKGGNTYLYDSVQKVFTPHQPKIPLGEKKIKMSNKVEGVKENALGEGVSQDVSSDVRGCETQARNELVNAQGFSEEAMESSPSFTALDSATPAKPEPGQKRTTEAALNVDKTPSKKDEVSLDGASARLERPKSATQKQKPVANTRSVDVSLAGSLRKHNGEHGSEGKQDKLLSQGKAEHRDTKKTHLDSRSQKSPQVSPAHRPPTHIATPKQPLSRNQKQKDIKGSGVTAVDTAIGPAATELQTLSTAPKSCTTVNMETNLAPVTPIKPSEPPSRPRRQGTTLRRCQSAGDAEDALCQSPGEQGCRKGTNPCAENVSVSEPQQLAEVTQAQAQPNQTDAPPGLKTPAPPRPVAAPPPRRTPSEEPGVAGGQQHIAHHPVPGTRRTARDHSRGSSERNSVPFTDPATFPDRSLGNGQSSLGCSVSHAIQHPGESAVKTEEGLDGPLEGEVDGHQAGTSPVCEERRALGQRKVDMEVDVVVALKEKEKAQIGATLDDSQKETVSITHAGVSHTEMKNEPVIKSRVETHPMTHKTNITGFDTRNQQVTMELRSINVPNTSVSEQQINPLKESDKPEPYVLSVAEMMRSQIKALDSKMSNPSTDETSSASVDSIAATPIFALSTKKEAAKKTVPDLREEPKKVHDIERALTIEVEEKIETKPPDQPPKPSPPNTEAVASFNVPPQGEDNATVQDLEKTVEIDQRVEAIPGSTPALLDPAAEQFGLQPRINPTECSPEQPQTPTAPSTEVLTSSTKGDDIVKGLDVESTKAIEGGGVTAVDTAIGPAVTELQTLSTAPKSCTTVNMATNFPLVYPIKPSERVEAIPVSTPAVLDTTAKQFGLQPSINPKECSPEQPQTATNPSTEVITTNPLTRGEDIVKGLDVESTKEMEPKTDPNSVSMPEVPDITLKLFETPPGIHQQTTTVCTADPALTPITPAIPPEAILSFSIPPITVIDTESFADTGNTYSSMENEDIVDTGHECGTPSPVSLGNITDAPPAGATDLNTTITCSFNASLGGGNCKALTESNLSVTMTQEHRKPPSSVETGIDTAELCCTGDSSEIIGPSLEHHSPQHLVLVQGTDEGFKQIPNPELQLNIESNLKSMPVLSTTCVDAQKIPKLNRSSVETKQVIDSQQERNLSIIEPSTTAIAPQMPSLNDEAPLQEVKSDAPTFSSATPKELALGARRKILIPKPKTVEDNPTSPKAVDREPQSEEVLPKPSKVLPGAATPYPLSVPPSPSQQSLLAVEPIGQRTPPVRRRSPLLSRKSVAQETPGGGKESLQQPQAQRSEEKSAEKEKPDPFKAPQVIRKIRGESFSDASGHLKLWCQFFNVLSDSVISWYRDDVEVVQVNRSAGDETPVNLAIVQASKRDCGVYGCKITNDHGTDITDLLLSAEILGGMRLREDLGVGEEIEMTPLLLNKGVADSGVWGNKFFGRVMVQESHIGGGCSRKTWRAKVVYGLEPVFESGTTCVIKMGNRIAYGGKGEAQLTERNVEMERQRCRIQSLAREYCKIFSAESRVVENFGPCLEVIPVYLMYRPANTVPYATVETDLKGVYLKYCKLSAGNGLVSRTGSEVELKCCALQHWIHQWTNGNLLFTQMEGVDNKLTNVGISIKSTGYQGLSAVGNPDLLEQFVSQHQCNYYCGLLGLRSLKPTDSLQTPSSKSRGSKSPLLQRKTAAGTHSPGTARRVALSPRLPRKADGEQDRSKSPMKAKEDSPSNITS
ncbi:alpha-protein kinase 3 isoform X2 [Gadus chalcogrammus]|uniref:alpha-protein kinase 3 isoform X2 n=1 Tax=Gadus chalcogrammus TaxID=1042646 RepID=UPI0024C4B89F|nr:alpha-protein kinase 3 isoform X2 [Gadus chalcogrammus]